jgi:glycosyltransferase involved in cell wall biosynthesis
MNIDDFLHAVSLIIPMYNERKRVSKTMSQINEYLRWYKYDEVVFVDDGSTDGTALAVKKMIEFPDRAKVIRLQRNEGKWAAIKKGFEYSSRAYCALLDMDLSIDPENINDYRQDLVGGVIFIGNRYGELKEDNNIPFRRKLFSRAFNVCVRLIVGLNVHDSQAPLKIFKRNLAITRVFYNMKEKGFAGDVEFLARAGCLGLRLKEVDVVYSQGKGSTVNIKKHAWPMFKSLLRTRKYAKKNIY